MEQTAPDGVDGRRPFTVHVFGHTTVSTPDRTLRASDFTGVKPRQISSWSRSAGVSPCARP